MSESDNEAAEIRPAVHRCLGIAEVLRNIVRFAGQDSSQNVAAISLSCRLVHDVAQDVLWENLTTMHNLLKCFPEDVWSHGDHALQIGHFLRPPAPTEWTRFLANAARVKSFSKAISAYEHISVAAWSMLGVYRPVQDVFPNIQRLEWQDDGDGTLTYANLFITDKLRSLVLRKDDDEEFEKLTLILDSVVHLCPPLREFRFDLQVDDCPEEIDDIVSELILSTGSTFEIFDSNIFPTRAAVAHLAKLPSLKTAKLRTKTMYTSDATAARELGTRVFPTIETLHLDVKGTSGQFDLALAGGSVSLKLTDLSVTWQESPRWAAVYSLFDALGRRQEPWRLRKLSFTPRQEWYPQYLQSPAEVRRRQPSCEINLQTLRLLFQLPYLTHLHITSYFLVIDDHVIEQLVSHLPQLESLLLLPGFYGDENPPRATPDSIVYAVQHLRCLRALGFPVDFSQPFSVDVERRMWYNQSCSVLNFAHSPLPAGMVNSVASLLSLHFWHPRLEIIAFDRGIDGNIRYLRDIGLAQQRRLWEQCRGFVKLYREVRLQERARYDCLHFPVAQSYPPPRSAPGSSISWPLPARLEN